MKKKLLTIGVLLLCMCLLSSCTALSLLGVDTSIVPHSDGPTGAKPGTTAVDDNMVMISKEQYERYQMFDGVLELMDLVDMGFYEEVDEATMVEGAARGVLAATGDPYTYYYNPEEFAEMWEEDEGEYAGIGIQISTSYITGISTVSRIFKNSPAEAVGVQKGDILYKVEDLMVSFDTVNDAVDIMRGTPGTDVQVTFLRDGEEVTFTITRGVVTVNRVESGMLAGDIGYIIVYDFSGDCDEKFEAAVNELVAEGAKGLILDLRDNPGGWVEDGNHIADVFLDAGTLCYLEYRDGKREYYRTTAGKLDIPLVILINENSASTSEIVTGCLMERADATVVGKKSFGKGIVQSVIPVGDEGAGMQMTVAQYFTPNGNAVHKIGITPHVEVDLAEGDNGMHNFGDLTDAQLAEALRIIREKVK